MIIGLSLPLCRWEGEHARDSTQEPLVTDRKREDGAEGGTRTPTGCPTRPSNVRVCQFRHFGASRMMPPPRRDCQDAGRGAPPPFPNLPPRLRRQSRRSKRTLHPPAEGRVRASHSGDAAQPRRRGGRQPPKPFASGEAGLAKGGLRPGASGGDADPGRDRPRVPGRSAPSAGFARATSGGRQPPKPVGEGRRVGFAEGRRKGGRQPPPPRFFRPGRRPGGGGDRGRPGSPPRRGYRPGR